tara:strand:+ start:173 stop:1030 length:858 start_codon:yes stop_codon:yes gene_type:complete
MDNEEKVLRAYIRKAINIVKERTNKKEVLEEEKLRKIIRGLIFQEAELKKHRTTGENKVEWFLSKSGFKERLQEAYESLTTSEEQRDSFRKHILWHIEDTMFKSDPSFIMQVRQGRYDDELAGVETLANQPTSLQEVVIDVDVEENEKLMGKGEDSPEKKRQKDIEAFSISGLDRTGLIDAFNLWDKGGIDQLLLNTWNPLVEAAAGSSSEEGLSAADRDKLIFYKLALEQIGFYFDEWEKDAAQLQRSRETAASMETPVEPPVEEPSIELSPEVGEVPEEEEGF